jgi:prepilin signal peptidase PulO-like enzyme (type II secretory pathway)
VEILTGALFVWWYWGGTIFFQLTQAPFAVLQPLFWLTVGILLLIIFVSDARYYIIPDGAVGLLAVVTVIYRVVLVLFGEMRLVDLGWAAMGVVLTVSLLGGLWLATKGKGIGLGDVKLMVPLSLLLGWPIVTIGLFLAFVLGAIVGVVLILLGKKKFGQTIPFGPFLITAACFSLLWGDVIFNWYMGLLK